MKLKGTQTETNLLRAFVRESQANVRYAYFAQKADIEGYPGAATLFKNIAASETGYALGHLEYLATIGSGDPVTGLAIGDTEENFRSAIASETYEHSEMYPLFAQVAREENLIEIADWFDSLVRAQQTHAERFLQGLDGL
jgi:rubrerythrin